MNALLRKISLAMLAACTVASAYANYPYWEQRQSQFALLPVDSTDIVFLGNSLTDAGKWSEMFGMTNVKNRGIVSDIIDGVAQRSQSVTAGHPAKIFLLIGINDISHHLTADSISTAVEKLVVKLHNESPKTEIYMQSYLPINNDFGVYKTLTNESETVLKCNVLLEQVAKRNNCTWINLFPALMDKDCKLRANLTADGLHLREAGYLIWRDMVAPYVAPGKQFTDQLYPIPEGAIAITGNSIVRYGEWTELLPDSRVRARGTWADTSKDISIITDYVASAKPAQMFIQSSLNEYTDKFNADTIVSHMEKAIKGVLAKSPNTQIYLESIIPVNSSYEKYASLSGKGKDIVAANRKLRKLAKKYKIGWIDITTPLSDANGELKAEYTNNGFSLMGAGYKVWADTLKPYLAK